LRPAGYLPPLPESHAKSWESFAIEARRVLVLSDIHFPFHDVAAIECALAYGEIAKRKIDAAPGHVVITDVRFANEAEVGTAAPVGVR
jgi:hypothetical protein